jgi:putative ABC transport system ATP-binding protein
MTGDVLLESKGIVKVLGQGAGMVRALKGVDLVLHGGELTLLMGPSGSGKTTLLSILGCILSPTEGEVVIRGRSTKGLRPEGLARLRRSHVGFVFQDYNLFPTLTALENIRLALDVRGLPKAQQRATAEESLVEVGLADKINSYPSQMSGGQQQRVAIARSLAGKPSVILADEPTAALDSENGQAIMALLAEIARDPDRAVLAVTHDPRTLGYADRIVHIEDGLIVREERPRSKATHPLKSRPDDGEPEASGEKADETRSASAKVAAEPAADDSSVASDIRAIGADHPTGDEEDKDAEGTDRRSPDRRARPSLDIAADNNPDSQRRRSRRYARGEHLP